MNLESIKLATASARTAATNLETIMNLIDGQDTLKVSGHDLAGLLRPVVAEIFFTHDELSNLALDEKVVLGTVIEDTRRAIRKR